jgi:hypothetical protein
MFDWISACLGIGLGMCLTAIIKDIYFRFLEEKWVGE